MQAILKKRTTMKAKPFVKWVGGKTQLIEQLEALLPADFDKWENVTYSSLSWAEEQCFSTKMKKIKQKSHFYVKIFGGFKIFYYLCSQI